MMPRALPYILIECANTHGGDPAYLNRLIDSVASYEKGFGIKFQPLAPDTLATPDFPWYEVYKSLYFDPNTWCEVIDQASMHKEVWLDLFDTYGVQILGENLSKIHGIKFQSSVLYNDELIHSLRALDLSNCALIVNIAAQDVSQIENRIQTITKELQPKTLCLEIGFQAYPTELSDSGLSKIEEIKSRFGLPIVFADHLEGSSTVAIYTPIIAWLKGADIIEKHIMLDDAFETKYDHFSSLTPDRFSHFVDTFQSYVGAMKAPFINDRERTYLAKTVMVPVAKRAIEPGELIGLMNNVHFRRSGKTGLTLDEIKAIQSERKLLCTEKSVHETLTKEDFRPARIGAIVACRMKSSRLKQKALLPIGDLPSVEFCLRNVATFQHLDAIVLATSTAEEDAVLTQHTFAPHIGFYQGDPEDVMQRYIDVCDAYALDVVVRITADMPFVDDAIFQQVLSAHFLSGADYTVGSDAVVGVNLEVFNAQALKRIKAHFPHAEYSEYMTWYFQNNPNHVCIQKVELPELYRRPYRLTLDYEEDLVLFNAIHQNLVAQGKTPYSLKEVVELLDARPDLTQINQHLTLTYKTDQSLIDLLNDRTKIKA
jgi:spore coat polysaccharide biosynthesis protein SpsF (cytidylyltransferase family)/sialic acid synthase SpsE